MKSLLKTDLDKKRDLNFKPCENYKELVNKTSSYKVYSKKEYDGKVDYLDIVCAFDIETSSFYTKDGKKHACMYCWQVAIEGNSYVGRSWDEFEEFIAYITDFYCLNTERRLIIWVHNLAYEFAWICKRFHWYSVFAREKRSPMKAVTTTGIEFRCSYILAGSSLATVSKNLTTYKVSKLDGFDYDLVRGPETPLTDDELQYAVNDVLVVTAYIWEQIDIYRKITNIPLTNTGRVRNLCRKNCLSKEWYWKYKNLMAKLTITDTEEYNALKRAFGGGFTHANFFWSSVLCQDVMSKDFTSSYPAVMVAERFPMSKAKLLKKSSIEYIKSKKTTCCFVFNLKFENLRPKLWQDSPLSFSKCYNVKNAKTNNGRVISADELTTTTTDVDFEYLEEFYDWDSIEVGRTWEYKKAYLPTPFVETIIGLYEDKTTLKDVEGMEVEYLLKKGMLNSLYGMAVMDIVTEEVIYDELGWDSSEGDVDKQLYDYNTNEKRFLFYPWGVFVTAYARRNLFYAIKELGDDYIYADTDSVKYMNPEKHEPFFLRYNEWIIKRIKKAAEFHKISPERTCPFTVDGVQKPLGVFDDDGFYTKFKTLGAKRYLVEEKGKLKATVAGVSKKGIAEYISQQKNPFDFFDDNMTIPASHSGKTQHAYIDDDYEGVCTDYLGNKFYYQEKSGIHMSVSEYNLTISELYKALLNSKYENRI